jgi:hypothetical protein
VGALLARGAQVLLFDVGAAFFRAPPGEDKGGADVAGAVALAAQPNGTTCGGVLLLALRARAATRAFWDAFRARARASRAALGGAPHCELEDALAELRQRERAGALTSSVLALPADAPAVAQLVFDPFASNVSRKLARPLFVRGGLTLDGAAREGGAHVKAAGLWFPRDNGSCDAGAAARVVRRAGEALGAPQNRNQSVLIM